MPLIRDLPYSHFSERYSRAYDSEWYRRAVEHHAIEPESFVFSVPFRDGSEAEELSGRPPLVLATHAVFVESRGHRAPAAVVGLHFQLDSLAKHFLNVTSAVSHIQNDNTLFKRSANLLLLSSTVHSWHFLQEDLRGRRVGLLYLGRQRLHNFIRGRLTNWPVLRTSRWDYYGFTSTGPNIQKSRCARSSRQMSRFQELV